MITTTGDRELKDATLQRENGKWMVRLTVLEDGIWTQSTKGFDGHREALGWCECNGWRMPLPMWIHAVENEPAGGDPTNDMVLEP